LEAFDVRPRSLREGLLTYLAPGPD